MGPAAGGERRDVAADEIDRLRIDTELIRHDLPEARLVALSARLRSDDESDAVRGQNFDRDAFVRHANRGLDVIGDADPEQPAALLCRLAARGKTVPVRGFERAGEVAGEIPAVVGKPGRRAMRQLVTTDQVATAQLHAVDLEPSCGNID